MTIEQKNYTHSEMLEIIRQIMFHGDPDYYEQGGKNFNINFPHKGTYKRAEDAFNKYYLKIELNHK